MSYLNTKNIRSCQIHSYFKEEIPILVRSLFIFRKPLCFPMSFLYYFLMFEKKLTGKRWRSYPRMPRIIPKYRFRRGKMRDKMRK